MFRVNRLFLLSIMVVTLFHLGWASANDSLAVREVLSVKTGDESSNIKNQFVGATIDPYDGFAVDSTGNILISDTVNHRIMRFSKEGKLTDLIGKDRSLFWPLNLCLTEDDVLYVKSLEKEEDVMIVFLPDGKALKSYRPATVFEHQKKKVPILSISCNKKTVKVVYMVYEIKVIRPVYEAVYEDEYDKDFKLIKRKDYDNPAVYYNTLKEINKEFEKHFEDSHGNKYGYPLEKDWIGKSLPLKMYSIQGVLLRTIDGPLLTRHTQYKIYDYYTMKVGLGEMKGNDFLIVNWYVTPSGIIYALIANTEYVKVLRVDENKKK